MNKKIIIANWKMNLSFEDSLILTNELESRFKDFNEDKEVVVCPDFIAIERVRNVLDNSVIGVGSQDVSIFEKGAFTGDISINNLEEVGCKYVIIGHSERRKLFNESNLDTNKKMLITVKSKLIPILCVGENITHKKEGRIEEFIREQLEEALKDVIDIEKQIIIAYEPIWAIGTGKVISQKDVIWAVELISNILVELYNEKTVENNFKIVYGGSVNSDNVKIFSDIVDGLLVGGASLKSDSFFKIVSNF